MTCNKWAKRYLNLAKEISTWSKDPSTQIGAVIIGNKGQIVSQGYNGFPRGIKDSEERYNDREIKYKYTIHAEANAIYNSIHNNADVNGCSLYCYGLPICSECAKLIIQTGIKEVYVNSFVKSNWKESCDLAIELFKESGIKYTIVEECA